MNKLEKMKSERANEVEKVDTLDTEGTEEIKEEKKIFSLFTFWKKLRNAENEDDGIVEIGEKEEKRGFLKYFNARTAVLCASLLIIAVAGYLNVHFMSVPADLEEIDENGISMDALSPENTGEVNTPTETEDYFALSVINRERVRDEAFEMLQDLTTSDAVDAVAKADAYSEMTRMANEITSEANIESLVKAKGFNNCVAVVSGDDVNVVVESSGLSINQVAQIKEIVYLECGVHPDNIKIIEKAGV